MTVKNPFNLASFLKKARARLNIVMIDIVTCFCLALT